MLVSSSAVFYQESDIPLLETFGIYGGYYFAISSDIVGDVYGNDGRLVIWVPVNYKDYFSSDSNALVNVSSSTLTLRAYDYYYNAHSVRFQPYGYLQLRSDDVPYSYYTVSNLSVDDTNIHVMGVNSPFYNSNPPWDDNTKYICMTLGLCTLLIVITGVFKNARSS